VILFPIVASGPSSTRGYSFFTLNLPLHEWVVAYPLFFGPPPKNPATDFPFQILSFCFLAGGVGLVNCCNSSSPPLKSLVAGSLFPLVFFPYPRSPRQTLSTPSRCFLSNLPINCPFLSSLSFSLPFDWRSGTRNFFSFFVSALPQNLPYFPGPLGPSDRETYQSNRWLSVFF